MNILLLHPTFWPVPGGAESQIRAQAEGLSACGHLVTVLTGIGQASSLHYRFENHEALRPDFPLNLQVKRAVDHGQTDNSFHTYAAQLRALIEPHAAAHDILVTHGALTTHFNLALTRALWDIARNHPTIAVAHDFTPANKSYAVPLPDLPPWSLVKTPHPNVVYVAVSRARQRELHQTLGIDPNLIPVIPPMVDWASLMHLPHDLWHRLREFEFWDRDLVLFCPARLLQRKNIDLAFLMLRALHDAKINALLLVSAPPDPAQTGGDRYRDYLLSLPAEHKLREHIVFLHDWTGDPDLGWLMAYRLCDVVLFPSLYEGYGLPVMEALAARLPCWTTGIPAVNENECGHVTRIAKPEDAVRIAQQLLAEPEFVARKTLLRDHHPRRVWQETWEPVLQGTRDWHAKSKAQTA